MQAEPEVWTTVLFNRFLAGPLDSFLSAIGHPSADPSHPWENWITMEILVVAVIMVLFAVLKSKLSVDNPGKLQLTFEALYKFLSGQAHDALEHGSNKYLPFIGTLFIFILFMNLVGVIPGFESPTMTPAVPCALAISVFLYYNYMGVRAQGIGKYIAHFAGPVWWLAPIMIPIEVVSHIARPLSLTIRLFANMFAGERVTLTFLTLTYFAVPAVFMGLHVFVAFLQAFIFMLLSVIYIAGAVAHEEH